MTAPIDTYIRKSMLEDYSFCPYKFKHNWMREGLEGIPLDIHSVVMSRGTRFHDFAKKFWDYVDILPIDRWMEMIPKQFSKSERNMAVYFIQMEMNRHRQYEKEGRLDEWRPVARETKLVDTKLRLSSTFDRLDWWDKSKNELAMIEYKTGDSFFVPAILRQLAFYAILWENTMNLGDITHMIYINPNTEMVETFEMTNGIIEKVITSIIDLRQVMINGGPYERKCSKKKLIMCKMCTPAETGVFMKNY